jgi:hypothetical protein
MNEPAPNAFGYDSSGHDYPYRSAYRFELMMDSPNFTDDEFALIANEVSEWSFSHKVPCRMIRSSTGFRVEIEHQTKNGQTIAADLFNTLAGQIFTRLGKNVSFRKDK